MPRNYNFNDNAFGSLLDGAASLFGGGLLTYLDDISSTFLFGRPDASTEAWGELSGRNSQLREFEQQEYLIDKQNAYNDPSAQMQRMMAAGINPNLAAAGIAGSGNASASPSPVASNTQGAAQAAQQATNAAGTVADIIDKASQSNERSELLEERKKQLVSDIYLKYKEAGYTELESQALAINIAYMPIEKYLSLMAKVGEIKKLGAEYNVFMQDIENKKQQIKESEAKIEVYRAERDYKNALELEALVKADKAFVEQQIAEWRLNKMQKLNIDPNNPAEVNMFNLGIEGDDKFETGLSILSDINYNKFSGQYKAETEFAPLPPGKLQDIWPRVAEKLGWNVASFFLDSKVGEVSRVDYYKFKQQAKQRVNAIKKQMEEYSQSIDDALIDELEFLEPILSMDYKQFNTYRKQYLKDNN